MNIIGIIDINHCIYLERVLGSLTIGKKLKTTLSNG